MDSDPPADPRDQVEFAGEVLQQHTPDRDGWCMGCMNLWARLVLFDQCTQAQWATAVHAAYTEPPGQASHRTGRIDRQRIWRWGGEGS